MDCYCDYEPAKFLTERRVKAARKAHQCCECYRKIQPGEPYTETAGLWDYFQTFKTCQDCQRLRDYLTISFTCYCWAYGDQFEDLRDFLDSAHRKAGDEIAGVRFRVGRLMVQRKRARQANRMAA